MLLCRHRRGFKQSIHLPEGPPPPTDSSPDSHESSSSDTESPDAPTSSSLGTSPSQAAPIHTTSTTRHCGKCKQSLVGLYDCNGCGGSFCEACKDKLTALRGPTVGAGWP